MGCGAGEKITAEEQLRRWVEGAPVHRLTPDRKVGKHVLEGGECCPDFSCCRPELLAPVEVRKAFAVASRKERGKLLAHFLGALIEGVPVKVHIVTGEVPS